MGRTPGSGVPARRVVIVGGGFAGLFTTRALRRRDEFAITLVDRAQHHLFQPLLYQVATGILSEGQIAAPLRDVLKRHRNVECVLAEVVEVDTVARHVVAERPLGGRITLPYDDLIVAAPNSSRNSGAVRSTGVTSVTVGRAVPGGLVRFG